MSNAKQLIKTALAFIGVLNPALGTKISGEAKAAMILQYRRPGMTTLVETGTNRGNMIDAVLGHYERIYSIELDQDLFHKAVQRFSNVQDKVQLLQGDSGTEIHKVLPHVQEPSVFWLDAHGLSIPVEGPNAAPVEKELEAIFGHTVQGHVILIDDGRHFTLRGVHLVKRLAKENGYSFDAKDGIFILQ